MTVTSVRYGSAVGRSALPYCNSDVVIKVGVIQVGSLKKNTHSYCAYYRSPLFRLPICHKHCMTVTSVLYRSAV